LNILVRKLSKNDIRLLSDDFSSKYNPEQTIPVPIDIIIEAKFNIDIVPIADLKDHLDNDGFISSDFTTIYIDQDVYFNIETRYRFSLAHEIGHLWLHRDIYKSLKHKTINEWKKVYLDIDDKDYNWLEIQANNFAGFVLVPDYALESRFKSLLQGLQNYIQEVRNNKYPRDLYLEYVVGNLARKLAPAFNVSASCMETRIRNDARYTSLIV
jgi:Zn-dependent peptidase ImmA (M78 family)